MGYSAEVVRRARQQLAADVEARLSQQQEHLQEAYRRVPRIREIDLELRRTMVQAAQAAFSQGDAQALLEEAKQHNLALQAERAKLVEEKLEPGYLDETPVCAVCSGTGYIGASMCQCLNRYCRAEQRKELHLLSGRVDSFSQFRLDYYPERFDPRFGGSPRELMKRNLDYCREYASFFSGSSGNLLFVGGTGLGKTYLSTCIAKTVTDRGCSVCYAPAGKLFNTLESAKFSPTEEIRAEAAQYSSADLLILDDLGTEMPSQFVTASLYALLNDRLLEGKAMIVSTNLTAEELSKRYTPQIASRLIGDFHRITFVGEDIRVAKSRGKL